MNAPGIGTTPFRDFDSATRATLAFLRGRLRFSLWMMTRVEGEDWIVVQAEDQGYGIEPGQVLRWSDSLCSRMVVDAGPRVAPDAAGVAAYREAPIAAQLPIGAYIGVPVSDERGQLYGTLCAIDPERQPDAVADELPLVELAGRLLGSILAAELRAREQADIAERARLAEQALAEERWRLDNILRGTNVGSWEWNVQTGETVFNERWAEIVGYTLEEISPVSIQTWMDFAHPDDLQQSNALLEAHWRGESDVYEFESRMRHRDGSWVWVLDRGRVFSWTQDGRPLWMFGTHQDITRRKRAEEALLRSREQLAELAQTDELTGLLNRRGWLTRVATEEGRARRAPAPAFVIVVDLDGLKLVNDRDGHEAGDRFIADAALAIRETLRECDVLARIGGDEFAVLGAGDAEAGYRALERLQKAFGAAGVEASAGLAVSVTGEGIEHVLAEADAAMYQAKKRRRAGRDAG